MSEIALLHFSALVEDSKNIRKFYSNIDELAQTICECGLLQNLVVTKITDDRYLVKEGNRRRRAIGLLIEKNIWDKDKPIPCLIIDTDGNFEQVIAGVQKQDFPMWHLGFRFNEFQEMGATQEQISVRIGKSRGFISRAQQIATYLAPETIKRLDQLPPGTLTNEQVYQVSRLVQPTTLEPDAKAQLEKINNFINVPKRLRLKGKKKNSDLSKRFHRLKGEVRIPVHAVPYVTAIINYLDGSTSKLKF